MFFAALVSFIYAANIYQLKPKLLFHVNNALQEYNSIKINFHTQKNCHCVIFSRIKQGSQYTTNNFYESIFL